MPLIYLGGTLLGVSRGDTRTAWRLTDAFGAVRVILRNLVYKPRLCRFGLEPDEGMAERQARAGRLP